MKVQSNGSVVLSKQEWEQFDHLLAEMGYMMDRAKGDFIESDNYEELCNFLDEK